MENNESYEVMATKVAPWAAEVWNHICEAFRTDTYHMLQNFIYAMIRGASDPHKVSPEVRRLMDELDMDVGWQNAINVCAPQGKQSIMQIILIVEQADKRGAATYMLDRPWMGDVTQTENVDIIFERVTEVVFRRLYMKMRQLGLIMNVKSQRELLNTLLDRQTMEEIEQDLREQLPGLGDSSDGGRQIAFGKKTKSTQHRTPDSVANDQRFHFDEEPVLPAFTSNATSPTLYGEASVAIEAIDDDRDPWNDIENGLI